MSSAQKQSLQTILNEMFVFPPRTEILDYQQVVYESYLNDEFLPFDEARDNASKQKKKRNHKNPLNPGNNQKQSRRRDYFLLISQKASRKACKPVLTKDNDRTLGLNPLL